MANNYLYLKSDSHRLYFGAGDDAYLNYDGTDLVCNPAAVGTGAFKITGLLNNTGGRICNTTRVTSGPYTVLSSDRVIFCDTDGGSFTVNLPAGVEGTHYKILNCGSNTLTVDPNGTEELYGAGAGVAATLGPGEVIDIHYNATEGWY
jgi:hypothetical protein